MQLKYRIVRWSTLLCFCKHVQAYLNLHPQQEAAIAVVVNTQYCSLDIDIWHRSALIFFFFFFFRSYSPLYPVSSALRKQTHTNPQSKCNRNNQIALCQPSALLFCSRRLCVCIFCSWFFRWLAARKHPQKVLFFLFGLASLFQIQ